MTARTDWPSHLRDQAIENARFLLANGVPLDQVLARVGVLPGTWQRWTERGWTR